MTSIVLLVTISIFAIQVTMLGAKSKKPPMISWPVGFVPEVMSFFMRLYESVAPVREGCPYLHHGQYAVSMKHSRSGSTQTSGCGYIKYDSSDNKPQTWSFYLEDNYYHGPNCKNRGVENLRFQCLSKAPTNTVFLGDISKGQMIVSFRQDEGGEDRRCAMYKKTNDFMDIIIQVVISKTSSCNGLDKVLENPDNTPWDSNASLLFTLKSDLSMPTEQ